MGRWIIFESAAGMRAYARSTHLNGTAVLSWEDLLARWGEPQTQDFLDARAQFIKALAGTPSERGDWFSTVEQLREAPLHSLEDAEYCFTFLPATQKNQFLLQLVKLYLNSDLAQRDRVARNQNTIRAIEAGEVEDIPRELVFLRAPAPSTVFRDLANACTAAFASTTTSYLETWEANLDEVPSRVFARPAFAFSQNTPALDRFAQKVAHEYRKRASALRVYFEGTPASRAYLQCKLAQQGIAVVGEAAAAPTFRSNCFEALRRLPLRLSERLAFAQSWLKFSSASSDISSAENWIAGQALEDDRKQLLLEATVQTLPPPPLLGEPLELLGFHPLPPIRSETALYYLEPISEPEGVLALDGSERQRLRSAGFLIPEAAPHRERNEQRLLGIAQPGPGHSFVFFGGESAGEQFWRRVKTPHTHSEPVRARPIESNSVPAPLPSLSATALETYAQCPAKYFYSQTLHVRAAVVPSQSYALWFGKLTHRALEKVFRETPWREVDAAVCMKAFDAAVLEVQGLDLQWLRLSLRRRFEAFAQAVPTLERALREALGPVTPKRFEDDFEIPLGNARIRGRIDRVDETDDGAILVIDYKTGTVDFSPEQVRKGVHFQALLYALAAQARSEKSAGVLFYDLKQAQIRRGMVRESQVAPTAKKALTRGHVLDEEKWNTLLKEGSEHVAALAQAIASGDFAPTPSAAACEYCDYGVHCRARIGWSGGAA